MRVENKTRKMKTKVFLIVSFLFISVSLSGMQHSFPSKGHRISFSSARGDTGEYYLWLDIYDPGGPTYQWLDITGIGTKGYGLSDDNNAGPFTIGFSFPYYGSFRNQFYVNSNGAISFSDPAVYFPQEICIIPSSIPPNDLIISLGADLTFEGVDSAECYYYTNNVDTLILSYINIAAWDTGGITGSHTFQLILTRQDSCIYFQYNKQEGEFYDDLDCAGIEDGGGGTGLLVFYYTMPDSGYAVKFFPYDSTGNISEEKNEYKSNAFNRISVYPNPFTTSTTISFTCGEQRAEGIELKIYDANGRLVKSVPLTTNHLSLGTDLTPGIYFLKADGRYVGKVVKVR